MNFKPKRCLAVFLLYMVATAGCKPAADPAQPGPRPALPPGRNRLTGGVCRPANRGGPRRFHLPGRTSRSPGNTDEDITGRIRAAAVASVTGERDQNRENQRRMSVSARPTSEDCIAGKVESVTPGRVFISGQLEVMSPNVGYQADSAFPGQERAKGQSPGPSEIWQRLQPVVECGNSAMTITFRRRPASQVLLDRVNDSSVPLSRPPPRCGYSVQTTWKDLRLMAQYDACHVTRKHGSYELALLWRETPVKVSCPVSHIQSLSDGPLSVCCSSHSMSVKVQEASAAELLRVNVRGQWTPLDELVEPCGFTLDGQDGQLTIAAPFITCGIAVMNGKYTLSIRLGDKKFMLACPVSTPEEPTLSPEVMANIPDPPAETTEHSPESLASFMWTPPFYLAPPLYPHPPYHIYGHPNRHDSSISSPPTPAPIFIPPSLPPVGSLSEYQDYLLNPDFLNKRVPHDSRSSTGDTETSKQVLGGQQAPLFGVFEQQRVPHSPSSRVQVQVESPSLVPPTRQYHHYYQHPDIPLPEVPHIATPALLPDSPLLASVLHHPDAASHFNLDQFFPRQPDHSTHAQTDAPHSWYPTLPYSDHQWYHFPHFTDSNAPKWNPLHDLPAKTNVSLQQSSFELKPDSNPAWRRYEPLSDRDVESAGLNAGEVSAPEQSSFQSTHVHSFPFPHHYPHHYYRAYDAPERSLSGVSQTPSNNDPELDTFRPRSMFPLAEQDVPHEGKMNSESEPRLPSSSDHAFPVWLAQSVEAGHPSVLQVNPPHNVYPHNISEAYPDAEAPDELLDNEIEDFYLGQYLSFPLPDSEAESPVLSHSAEFSDMTGPLQRLTSDLDTYVDESEENRDVEKFDLLTEYPSHQQDFGLAILNPARLVVEYGSPGEVRLRSAHRPARAAEAFVAPQLRSAAGQTFIIFSFPSPFSESPTNFNEGDFHPEILFLCLTGVCSTGEGGCIKDCISSPNNDVRKEIKMLT